MYLTQPLQAIQPQQNQVPAPNPAPPPAAPPEPAMNPEPTSPANPDPIPTPAPTNVKDPFLEDIASEVHYSADTVVNEETGIPEVKPQPATGKEPLPDDIALKEAATFIELRDTIQSFGISWYADGNLSNSETYSYQEWQKKKLTEAWAPIIQKAGFKFSPWTKILLAETICTGPLIGLMVQNRKLRLENEELRRKLAAQEAQRAANTSDATVISEDSPPMGRANNKRAWMIDVNGFFVYDRQGRDKVDYIPSENRKARPNLQLPGVYERLCEANTEEKVKKAYNLN